MKPRISKIGRFWLLEMKGNFRLRKWMLEHRDEIRTIIRKNTDKIYGQEDSDTKAIKK